MWRRSRRQGRRIVSRSRLSPTSLHFRGGTITEVMIDIGDEPYNDLERDVRAAFARD